MKKQLPGWAVLLIITLVAGLALGGTYALTKDSIAAQAAATAENARKAALPTANSFEEMPRNQRISSVRGYAGPVTVQVTLDEDGAISALEIGDDSFSETPGLGGKALEPEFAQQFVGKKAPLALSDIDAIASATITSTAVVDAVNAACAAEPQVDWCYVGYQDGAVVGYVAQVTTQGFGGPLEVIAGLDTNMVLTGVSVGGANFSETAGLGAKSKDPAFSQQFVGKQVPVKVIKAGGTPGENTIDAITSATITSSAVASAVNKVADHVEKILFPEGRGDEIVLPERPETGVVSASAKGFGGPVWVEAAFDSEGKITYIAVGNDQFAETDGIGSRVLDPEFQIQFIGKTAPVANGDVDLLTGATVSSKAVVAALNAAYDASKGVAAEATPVPTLPEKPADEAIFGASAKGFAGPVWVEAAFDAEDKITYVSIGNDSFAETDGFGAKALEAEFIAPLVGKQMPLELTDIDAIAGATYTSQAVVDALNAAYAQARGTEATTAPTEKPAADSAAEPATAIAASAWTAEAQGYKGPVAVAVTFDGNRIASLTIGDDRFDETTGLGAKALEPDFAAQFIGKTAPVALSDIDAITSATITSQAVVDAINAAYEQSSAGQQ